MRGKYRFKPTGAVVALLILLVGLATWMLGIGKEKQGELSAASSAALRRPTGSAQLISHQVMPVMEGELCQWVPASAGVNLVAARGLQGLSSPGAVQQADEGRPSETVNRAPVRVIRDTYPAYSAVAVDTNSEEVYLLDENLFGYKVFGRLL